MSILENIGAGIVSVALFIGGLFGYSPEPVYAPVDEQALGADSVAYFGGQTYTLAGTGISSTASSFSLTSFTITQNGKKIQDSEMADTFYLTFEPGSRARQEFASCTTVVQNTDGTATISGCTRGLSPVTPYTASTSLQFAHGGGTSVIFSNTPQFYDQFTAKGNDEIITGDWTVPTPAGNSSIANKAYVLSAITGTSSIQTDNVSIGGLAGETFATGSVVFFQESDQRWYKLDVDTEAHYIDREIGIANGPGSNGVNISGGVTVRGLVTTTGLTAGANYFASSTAGATSTATTAQPIGVARSTTQLYFNPDLIDSTVYGTTTFVGTTTFSGLVTGVQRVTEYTSSSTYTKPSGLKYIQLEMWGGGGGGAGASTDSPGGGGGAYVNYKIEASLIGSTATITIGGGGTGGTGGTSGSAGSSTMFTLSSGTVIAYGGAGGTANSFLGANGGGIVSHGTTTDLFYTSTGLGSTTPWIYKGVGQTNSAYPDTYWGGAPGGGCNGTNACGNGGGTIYAGGGGGGGRSNASGSGGASLFGGAGGAGVTTGTATSGSVPGGGGGGAGNSGTGGNGAKGKVRITEYF